MHTSQTSQFATKVCREMWLWSPRGRVYLPRAQCGIIVRLGPPHWLSVRFGILGPSFFLLDAKIGCFSVPRIYKNVRSLSCSRTVDREKWGLHRETVRSQLKPRVSRWRRESWEVWLHCSAVTPWTLKNGPPGPNIAGIRGPPCRGWSHPWRGIQRVSRLTSGARKDEAVYAVSLRLGFQGELNNGS